MAIRELSVDRAVEVPARSLDSLPRPPGLPLVGNAHQLDIDRLHLQLEAWAAEYGDLFVITAGWKRILVVGDVELAQRLLQQRPHDFRRFAPIERVSAELDGLGLFSAEGDDWKRMRKLVLPALSLRQMRTLHPDLTLMTQRLLSRWQRNTASEGTVEPLPDLRAYTVDVTTQVVFGHDMNTLEQPESELQDHLSTLFTAVNRRVNALVPYWRYFQLPQDRAVERSKEAIHELRRSLIAEARERLANDPARRESPRTLLEGMLVACDAEPGERFTDDEVGANIGTLLLAGEDTTATTLAWVLHYLAHHPEVQTKLRAEADAVLAGRSVADQPEDIAKLRYAAAVTNETLRLRAVLPVNLLEAIHDVVLGDVSVPAGTPIFLLMRHCALLPRNFSRPREFNPERWMSGCPFGSEHTHNARATFAFGGGPRTCPGRALALIECALVISMAVRSFYIEPVGDEGDVGEKYDFTMAPTNLFVRLRPRPEAELAP
jgi:cytochrome P450